MENILKIIYDKTNNNEIINLKDIEKILELLVINKCLNDYILNINVQHIRSNNLASYSTFTKEITIYVRMIEQMVSDIDFAILGASDFEKLFFKNISILQVLLHEVEHACQYKSAYHENNLEALIIRMSYLVDNGYDEKLYEYCPEERLAEIKSFNELNNSVECLDTKRLIVLSKVLKTESLKRLLRGYHYADGYVNVPIVDYFNFGNKINLLNSSNLLDNVYGRYTLKERFKYGFPITINEYSNSMKKLVLSLQKNFNNRVIIE